MAHAALPPTAPPALPSPPTDTEVLYEGYLDKRGQVIRNWRPRYLILWKAGPRLQYLYRGTTDQWAPKAEIALNTITACA